VLKGRFKVSLRRPGPSSSAGAASPISPAKMPHAFLNLTGEPAEIIVVYVRAGGTNSTRSWGPVSRAKSPTGRRSPMSSPGHDMTLLGGPLTAD